MGRLFLISTVAVLGLSTAPVAYAQDVSPTLLIETGPSDAPGYRRTIFVKYLAGDRVNVNYRTETRSEFRQVPNSTPQEVISGCARGGASSLSEIKKFERDEAQRKRSGQAPEVKRFCIKNISDWEGRNRDRYLDPIFNGMPLAPKN